MSACVLSAIAFAATPIVTITSPANNAQTTSPVNFIATASSAGCKEERSSSLSLSFCDLGATFAALRLQAFEVKLEA